MVKTAYMKTIEMLFVIVISTIFLIVILPRQESLNRAELKEVIINLEHNDYFRNFVSDNTGCFNSTNQTVSNLIRTYLSDVYDYTLCIGVFPSSVPNKDIFVESLFFSGNYTETQNKIIRLYYWVKD